MDDMLELINKTTKRTIETFGDKSTKVFYEKLQNKQFMTVKCCKCDELFFPPQDICPKCLSEELEWVNLSGYGTLYAFTQQERALRFIKPDVIGIVELDEGFKILTRINAKFDELKIGQRVKVDFIEISKDLTLHQFVVVEEGV